MVSLRAWTVASTVLVLAILVVYGLLFEAEFEAILRASWILVVLGLMLGSAMILTTGFRLYVLCRALNVKVGFLDSVVIRGVGMFASYVTPTLIGGEPIRAILLQRRAGNNSSIGLVSSIVFMEVYLDIIICNVLTLVFGFSDIAEGNVKVTLPYLAALYQITSWTLILFIGLHGVTNSRVVKVLSRYTGIGADRIRFEGEGFKQGFKSIPGLYSLLAVLTSIGSLLVGALTFMLAGSISGGYLSLADSLKGFVFALSLGISPLPGGALGVEYGASLMANATTVIMWRFMSYYMILLVGGLITVYAVQKLKFIMPSKQP